MTLSFRALQRRAPASAVAGLALAAAANFLAAQTPVGPANPANPVPVPPAIAVNDGIVGGFDNTLMRYRMYLMTGLGSPGTPGAPVEFNLGATFAANDRVTFAIDQLNAEVIALAKSSNGTGPVEVWRISINGATVLSETLLTTLPGTTASFPRAIHRDRSGCIVTLCRPSSFGPTFQVHRLAVTRSGALAFQVPISNPANDMIDAIATDATGQILLGGTRAPYSAAAPGVTLSVSQAGGTPTVLSVIGGFHVISAAFDSTGVPAPGLSPQSLPPAANFSCGGTPFLFNYNSPPFVTLFTDIERNPAGTMFVMVGSGFFAFGQPGGLIRIGAVGCNPGAPPAPTALFPHGMGSVAIAARSNKFGCGCVPSTNVLPQIVETAPPVLGTQWTVDLQNGVPNAAAVFVLGRNDLSYQGAPLPQPLSNLAGYGGQADAFLLVNPLYVYPMVATNAAGGATNTRLIPNNTALLGTNLYSEWLVYESNLAIPPFSTGGMLSVVQ